MGPQLPQPNIDLIERRPDLEEGPMSRRVSTTSTAVQNPSPASRLPKWCKVPLPVRRLSNTIWRFIQGPKPPQRQRIRTFFPSIQNAPAKYLHKLFPNQIARYALGLVFFALWIMTFVLIISNVNLPSDLAGFGSPVRLSCTSSFW